MFPPPNPTGADPISEKKLDKGEGLWDVGKEIFGWMFYGMTKCIKYPPDKSEKVLREILRALRTKECITFKDFGKMTVWLSDASIGILMGKSLFTPFNQIILSNQKTCTFMKNLVIVDVTATSPRSSCGSCHPDPPWICYVPALHLYILN